MSKRDALSTAMAVITRVEEFFEVKLKVVDEPLLRYAIRNDFPEFLRGRPKVVMLDGFVVEGSFSYVAIPLAPEYDRIRWLIEERAGDWTICSHDGQICYGFALDTDAVAFRLTFS